MSNRQDISRFFSDKESTQQLKDKSLSSGIWILIGQIVGHSFYILSIILLARILTPEDYGLVAMVAVLTNFIQMFKDIGLNVATIQSKSINHAQISNLFWYNTLISCILGLIVAGCAPLLAWFYGRAELLGITLALATSFPISGLIIQHVALLQRQLQYKTIAIIQIISIGISIIACLIAAYCGMGYWSLVIHNLGGVIFTTILAFYYCPWIPSLPDRSTSTKHFLRFGGYLTGSNFCEYFSNNIDKIIIGKALNPAALGQYTKAFNLSFLPLRKVCFPLDNLGITTLSRLRDEPERYKNYYSFAQETLVILLVPFFALGITCSKSVFSFFLGQQWLEAAPIFSWFCLLSLATTCTSAAKWLFLSQDRTKTFLYFTLSSASVSILSFLFGIQYGVMGVTICYTAVTILFRTPLLIYLASRAGTIGIREQLQCFIPTLLLSAVIVCLSAGLQYLVNTDSDIGNIGLGLGAYTLTFTAAFFLSRSWHRRISKPTCLLLKKIGLTPPKIFEYTDAS